MAGNLTIGYPSLYGEGGPVLTHDPVPYRANGGEGGPLRIPNRVPYQDNGLGGGPVLIPNRVPYQGTPLRKGELPELMQFGDTLRGGSLYQLPPNYVGTPVAPPKAVSQPVAAAQPPQQAVSVTQPQQVAAPQSIFSVTALPHVDVPKLRPQQNDIRFIDSQGVDALDGGDASVDFGRRYAAAAATGAVPVVSNAMLAAMNRQHARQQAALSAATKAQDVNDMYAAMNDPNLRARAYALSKASGISFDLAMKQAVQSKLMEGGDYNLANRYEMSQILPQLDAEQQRRVTEAINTGGSATPVRGPDGGDLQTSGINYVHPTGEGTNLYTTLNHIFEGTPNAGTMYGVVNGSSSPTTAAFNLVEAGMKNNAAAQAQIAKQIADERARVAKAEETALAQFNKNLAVQAQLLRANASQQNAATRAATAGNNSDSQLAKNMIATLKALPDGDPRKAQIMEALTQMYLSPTSPTE